MKMEQLKKLTLAELRTELAKINRLLLITKQQQISSQLKDTSVFKKMRKDKARLNLLLAQKKLSEE